MLDTIMHFITEYGLIVVFASILVESSGLPVPGESMLVAAGVLAGQGKLDLVGVFLAAFAGGVLGDNVGYVLGHRYGRRLLYRHGAKIGLSKASILNMERRFLKRGPSIVLIARFILILRQLCGFIAGTAHMNWWHFSLYNALGAALWAGVYTGGAYLLGTAVERYLEASHWVFAGVALVFLIASGTTIWKFWREAREARGAGDVPDGEVPEIAEVATDKGS